MKPQTNIRPNASTLSAALLLLLLAVTPAQAKQVAAKVQFVVGGVTAIALDGSKRQLKKGDRVYTGDTIESDAQGVAQLIYRDRSRMAVRVNTSFKIEQYSYDAKQDVNGGSSVFSLLRGALRSVSGLIGKITPQNVTVKTPLATIGIRGTDHEVVHVVQQRGDSLAVNPGTYNKVYAGATVMKTGRGNLNLNLHQVGFVGGTRANILKPVQINELPRAIRDQIINKVPVQAAARTTTAGEAGKGASSRESGNKNSTVGGGNKGGSKLNAIVNSKGGNSKAAVSLPDVTRTPAGPVAPVPIPYPVTGAKSALRPGNGKALGTGRKPSAVELPSKALVPSSSMSIENFGNRNSLGSTKSPAAAVPVKPSKSPGVVLPTPALPPKVVDLPSAVAAPRAIVKPIVKPIIKPIVKPVVKPINLAPTKSLTRNKATLPNKKLRN